MAEIEEKVMQFVEDTLKKSPKMRLEELFERAKQVSASVGKLSKRQFNARYPLQVKRRKAQRSRPRKAAASAAPATPRATRAKHQMPDAPAARDSVRQILLHFATDIAAAEDRKDLVKVLAGVDRYVDQVMKGVAKA